MQERISTLYPDNEVLKGVCISFMIESPGKIRKMGPFEKLYFGSDTASFWQLKALQTILKCIIRKLPR
jgi:2-dehydropantoate 2-reductase